MHLNNQHYKLQDFKVTPDDITKLSLEDKDEDRAINDFHNNMWSNGMKCDATNANIMSGWD